MRGPTSASESLTPGIGNCHSGLGCWELAAQPSSGSDWLGSQLPPWLGKEETQGSKSQEGTFRSDETMPQGRLGIYHTQVTRAARSLPMEKSPKRELSVQLAQGHIREEATSVSNLFPHTGSLGTHWGMS